MQTNLIPVRGVVLPRSVLIGLQTARAAKLPKETGGFLIGIRRGPHIEITDATYQRDSDLATERSFERADRQHAREILAAWETHRRCIGMIGDWHSHPIGDGQPSGTDRQAWRKLSEACKSDCVGFILGACDILRIFLIRRKFPIAKIDECILFAEEQDDLVFESSDS